jgi:GxxExxY protein
MNTDSESPDELLVRERGLLLGDLTYRVIGAAMTVHNTLGVGFLEKVYERALLVELRDCGILAVQQAAIEIYYRGTLVGDYFADILVESSLLIELKTVEAVSDVHRAQVMNYLKATGLKVALIKNFARPKLEWERIVL